MAGKNFGAAHVLQRKKGADTAHCCLLPAFGSGSKSAPSTTILFVAHSLATSTEAACERAASAATAAATARFFFSIVYLSCLAVGSKDALGEPPGTDWGSGGGVVPVSRAFMRTTPAICMHHRHPIKAVEIE